LTSGRRSDYYVDGKQVTLQGRGLHLVALAVLQRCRELNVTAVGGLTLGADPIAAAVAALSGSTDDPVDAFIVRKQAKSHGTGAAIEGPPLHQGQEVVLVDDTLTTGGTFLQAAAAVRTVGAVVVEAICVVDREEGGAEALREAAIPLHALFRRSEFSQEPAAASNQPVS
ncbi:MAG: orotate phosphoribosyltransferase, partial [Candidatus Dormibacteraeota bacterium]|nr:orotate phosphoribosyltransferase [Candidatus Dormibacteraeota bacterium]